MPHARHGEATSISPTLCCPHGEPVPSPTSPLTLPLVSPATHTPELGPRLGGLEDVTLVQRALVACLLAQGLVELEL